MGANFLVKYESGGPQFAETSNPLDAILAVGSKIFLNTKNYDFHGSPFDSRYWRLRGTFANLTFFIRSLCGFCSDVYPLNAHFFTLCLSLTFLFFSGNTQKNVIRKYTIPIILCFLFILSRFLFRSLRHHQLIKHYSFRFVSSSTRLFLQTIVTPLFEIHRFRRGHPMFSFLLCLCVLGVAYLSNFSHPCQVRAPPLPILLVDN